MTIAPHEHGKFLNKCHIDCSNRGVCDHKSGRCKCFEGSWGENCAMVSNAGAYFVQLNSTNVSELLYGN